MAALANRQRRFGRKATYVFNLQINPHEHLRQRLHLLQLRRF
jgi:hypothetical protein